MILLCGHIARAHPTATRLCAVCRYEFGERTQRPYCPSSPDLNRRSPAVTIPATRPCRYSSPLQQKRGEPPQGAYSQGWRAGDFIFVPGTGPVDAAAGKIIGDTIEQQTEKAIDNIAAILEADGASLADVVKVTAHLSDPSLFSRYNAVYARRFSRPCPVRTTVGSDLGMSPGLMIEIDCIAYKTKSSGRIRLRSTGEKRSGERG